MTKCPSGVVTTFPSVDDVGLPKSVLMLHRKTRDGVHRYMVPIARDLTTNEAQRVVDAWTEQNAECCDDDDFDIEVTIVPSSTQSKKSKTLDLDAEKHVEVAQSWAKRKHEEWVREKTKEGWRYGLTVDIDEKTHPLLRPWDELPERYREVDLDEPQRLIDLMGEHGYVVVAKQELEAINRILRDL